MFAHVDIPTMMPSPQQEPGKETCFLQHKSQYQFILRMHFVLNILTL